MIRRFLVSLVVVAVPIVGVSRAAAPPFDAAQGAPSVSRGAIPVMLLDGESGGPYHDWQHVTPVLKKILDETGLFDTTVVTAPPAGADVSTFAPQWQRYKAVVMNYDAPDERWPAPLKTSFEQYVRGGGGFVPVHAADNAFPELGRVQRNDRRRRLARPDSAVRPILVRERWQTDVGSIAGADRQSRPTRSVPDRCA